MGLFDINDSPTTVNTNDNASTVLEPSLMMKAYFIILFCMAFMASYLLWKKVIAMDKYGTGMSLRGEFLGNILIFLTIYTLSWLPVLFLGILDGELESSAMSEGFKGQVANAHCALQDLLVRTFCMSIVITTAIYMRYASTEVSELCCVGRPNLFVWGMLVPVALVECTRLLLSQKEWLMPTSGIIKQLGEFKFSIKATPVLCVQMMDSPWLRQILGEWFLTMTMVATSCFCCLPCYRHRKSNEELESKSLKESLPSSDSSELQMESLVDLNSSPTRQRVSSAPSSQAVTSSDTESGSMKKSDQSSQNSLIDYDTMGLYAKGAGFLEATAFIGVLWGSILRPFMAISMYIIHTESYSNYLEIPTHVLLLIAIVFLPAEFNSKHMQEGEEEKEATNKQTSAKEKDENPIWLDEEDKGSEGHLKHEGREQGGGRGRRGAEEDVDMIWIEEDERRIGKLEKVETVEVHESHNGRDANMK